MKTEEPLFGAAQWIDKSEREPVHGDTCLPQATRQAERCLDGITLPALRNSCGPGAPFSTLSGKYPCGLPNPARARACPPLRWHLCGIFADLRKREVLREELLLSSSQ